MRELMSGMEIKLCYENARLESPPLRLAGELTVVTLNSSPKNNTQTRGKPSDSRTIMVVIAEASVWGGASDSSLPAQTPQMIPTQG